MEFKILFRYICHNTCLNMCSHNHTYMGTCMSNYRVNVYIILYNESVSRCVRNKRQEKQRQGKPANISYIL